MIISGIAIPIDKLNHNGWGLHNREIQSAVDTLKKSDIRLCEKLDHGCDFNPQSHHSVGKPIDVYLDEAKNAIIAKVSITNTRVQDLIKQGKIKAWSVFGTGHQNDDGWVSDYTNKSLTLVADPAWDDARFASRESTDNHEGLSDGDYKKFTAKYDIKEEAMPDKEEDKFTSELEKKFAAKDTEFAAKFDEITAKFDQVIAAKDTEITDLKKEVSELKASTVRLPKEEPVAPTITDITTDLTSVKASLISEKDVDKLVAAKLNEY
ncbi:MAG: hypothetical protein LLG05_10500, partial [Porphyromonadaceae bacterium]|nr:hypothetical protein [Porphyromonadaceae bacterium]